MSTLLLPSFRRQQLVLDFTAIKDACPPGLYLSLTPGNPGLWAGVLFVRKGPYAGAVLRFQIAFPDTYPERPPLVTFSSDIFHPLLVPLTTYTYNVSTTDGSNHLGHPGEDRLPPGAFSLRYAFPDWFPRKEVTHVDHDVFAPTATNPVPAARTETETSEDETGQEIPDPRAALLRVLEYVKEAFESDSLLDCLPVEAAGDPSAWHAWRAHRGLAKREASSGVPTSGGGEMPPSSPRHPGEWKWDGVWESRVQNGVETSIHEGTLFSSAKGGRPTSIVTDPTGYNPHQRSHAVADRQIRFTKLDDDRFAEIKGEILNFGATTSP